MKIGKFYVFVFFTIISAILLIVNFSVFPFNKILFLINFSITISLIVLFFFLLKNYMSYILSTSKCVNSLLNENSRRILNSVPTAFAICLNDASEKIISYNKIFKNNFLGEEDLTERSIKDFFPNNLNKNLLFESGVQITYNEKKFVVHCKKFEKFKLYYFLDNTEYKNLKKKYLESKICVGLAVFDNKEELYQGTGEDQGLKLLIAVENELSSWVSDAFGILKKLSDGKYLFMFEEKYLRYFVSKKFDILNKFHEIKADTHKFATVSLGIGRNARTLEEGKNWAENALNMALGRGGDQAVLKFGNNYEFFGGSSPGLEKRSKVRTRVVAMAIMEKINSSDAVFIMGHKLSDFDSVGAAIGLWSICYKMAKKSSYIVLDKENSMANSLIEKLEKFGYSNSIISPQEAVSKVTSNSFLIIVDTHSESCLESEKIYRMFHHIAIIDHHRMTVDKISTADIFFHEPFASSTCEMVTELIQYMGDKHLKKWESECLLAGIMLDTKSFTLKCGIRTFEAGAYLKKKGADSTEVKKLFADSIEIFKMKCNIIAGAYVLKNCAISKYEDKKEIAKISCVQAADELLEIKNIKASFVIFKNGTGVNISARSLGEINVQVLMENLGGGGHQTMAATHLENVSLEEVEEKLKELIEMNL